MTVMQPPAPGQPYAAAYRPPPKKGMPTWAIVLIVLAGVLIVFGGMCAAIAIPAFTKYMRRSKTSEARVQVAKLFDSIASYHAEHGTCPTDGNPSGHTGVTPPLSVRCGEGPGGRCVPNGSGGGSYPIAAWTDDPVWRAIPFSMEQGHYFHFDYTWSQTEAGCQFTVQAFGDLDDDGVLFSTFERTGAADRMGVNGAAGLYIDNEIE